MLLVVGRRWRQAVASSRYSAAIAGVRTVLLMVRLAVHLRVHAAQRRTPTTDAVAVARRSRQRSACAGAATGVGAPTGRRDRAVRTCHADSGTGCAI